MRDRSGPAAHEGKDAIEFLNRIGPGRMHKAERLARRGLLHPDPEVAGLTIRWANAVLSAAPKYPAGSSSAGRIMGATVADVLTFGLRGDFHFQRILLERRSRKAAQNIVNAARMTSGGSDARGDM